jgi:hypothetical protein
MKLFKVFGLFLAATIAVTFSNEAYAARRRSRPEAKAENIRGLSSICKKTSDINGALFKVTAGGHIGRSDPRYTGFSFICGSRCTSFPAKVYHCDGSQAFTMGFYGKWSGNGKSRAYCGSGGAPRCSTNAIRARSRALKCNGMGYLATGGGSCIRLNLNSNRNGDV